jgi:hypothetical protein
MGTQMYIVVQQGEFTQDSSRELQRLVRQCGGFILMVTRTSTIVALEDQQAAVVAQHPFVSFIGPVTLNPRGIAADRLVQIFAENLSKQLDIESTGGTEPVP